MISEAEIDELFDRLERGLARTLDWAKGEKLVVFFPQQGEMGGWDAMGRVVRCDQSTLGYRVALEFDPLLAA